MIQNPELQSAIIQAIVKRASGQYCIILHLVLIFMLIMPRFIFAKLLVADFASARHNAELEKLLADIDKNRSLDLLYKCALRDLETLPTKVRKLVNAALMWTLYAKRQLSTAELSCAITTTCHIQGSTRHSDDNVSPEAYQLNMQAVLSALGICSPSKTSPQSIKDFDLWIAMWMIIFREIRKQCFRMQNVCLGERVSHTYLQFPSIQDLVRKRKSGYYGLSNVLSSDMPRGTNLWNGLLIYT